MRTSNPHLIRSQKRGEMEKDFGAAVQALGGRRSKNLKTVGVHVRKGHAGGYIAKHDMEDEDGNPYHKKPEYPISTMADVHKHMQAHLGEEAKEAAKENAGQGDGEDC